MEEIRKYLDEWFVTNLVTRDSANEKKGEVIKQLREMNKYEMAVIGKTVGIYFNEKFPKVKKGASQKVEESETDDAKAVMAKLRSSFLDADELGSQIYMAHMLAYQSAV